MSKVKKPYGQALKIALQDTLLTDEATARERIKSGNCTLAEKLAIANVLNALDTPTAPMSTFIAKTTGDMVEQTEIKATNLSAVIKDVMSDNEY
jgi:hypothetical protein